MNGISDSDAYRRGQIHGSLAAGLREVPESDSEWLSAIRSVSTWCMPQCAPKLHQKKRDSVFFVCDSEAVCVCLDSGSVGDPKRRGEIRVLVFRTVPQSRIRIAPFVDIIWVVIAVD
jgi:hypothetical protein